MTATRPELADQPRRPATWSRSTRPTTSSKASWYESMGLFPLAGQHGRRPARQGPVRRRRRGAGDVRRRAASSRTGACRRTSTSKARKDLKLPDPRKLAQPGRRVPKTGHRDRRASAIRIGGFSAVEGFPQSADAPAEDQARRTASRSRTATRCPPMPDDRAGLAQHHLVLGAAATRDPESATRWRAGPIKFDSGQLGFGTGAQLRGDDPDSSTYTTPPLTEPRQDLHLLLPHTPVHARLDPGRGRRAQAPVAARRAPSTLPGVQ